MGATGWVRRWTGVAAAALAVAAASAQAQPVPNRLAPGGKSSKDADVPAPYRPAPGMCRVWLAGVPPNQQPAPTDCAAAVRNRPANGRVLFGDDYVARKTSSVRPGGLRWANVGERDAAGTWRLIPAVARTGAAPARTSGTAQDQYEAGYAAGYRDAMNGRRPRFRGADRLDPGTGDASAVVPRGGASPGGAYDGSYRRSSQGSYATPYGSSPYANPYGEIASGPTRGGAVVVVPPAQDPRYFNNGTYPPPGRANGICLDRDGDGWCDDPRFGPPVCRDLDGDGRCDDYPALAAAPFPSSLPAMRAGIDVQQGRGSATALRWLGTSEVVARVVDPKRSGTPYRVLWFDANTNALLQTWTDLDGDGVADRVEIFRNGRRVKLLGR